MLADIASGCHDIAHIGSSVFAWGRTHCDELNRAKAGGLFNVIGEVQTACFDIAQNHFFKTRLKNRDHALFQSRNFFCVGIKAKHVIANLRKTRARD